MCEARGGTACKTAPDSRRASVLTAELFISAKSPALPLWKASTAELIPADRNAVDALVSVRHSSSEV
jgi:hypothetical protein